MFRIAFIHYIVSFKSLSRILNSMRYLNPRLLPAVLKLNVYSATLDCNRYAEAAYALHRNDIIA